YYCFIRGHSSMVSQFNMVNQFGGTGDLLNFYAPYLCPNCSQTFEVLVDLRKEYSEITSFNVPTAECPTCKVPAEFDDVPESYFPSVCSKPKPNPPTRANALIDGDLAQLAATFRVEKEIEQSVTLLWLSGDLDRGAHFKRLADGLEGTVVLVLNK